MDKKNYQNSINKGINTWTHDPTGPVVFGTNPVSAALQEVQNLWEKKPEILGLGVIGGLNKPDSQIAAQQGNWGQVFGNVVSNTAKEVATDKAVQAALNYFTKEQAASTVGRASGFLGKTERFLAPVAQRLGPLASAISPHLVPGLVGKGLIDLGKRDSVLTTAVNQAGQEYDRVVGDNPNWNAILPKSNTGHDDPTGRVASERDIGKKAADAFVRGYNRFDGMLGGILPGGADPRFNGFNASRDLTPAQQVDYRRGGGDAARRQDPGLTPQQIIERGRQAIPAARRQQNQSTPPGTNPRRTSSPSVQSSRPATRPAQPTRRPSNGLNLWNEALHVADSFRRLKFPYFGR